MKTELFAGAFLTYGDRMLLLRRSLTRRIAPGMWSCVGGHVEKDEMNDPTAACYREIHEEAGILQEDVRDLRLRYIATRVREDCVDTVHYFFGALAREIPLPACDEGTLHWVPLADLPIAPMSHSVDQLLRHRLAHPRDEALRLLATDRETGVITWVRL